MVSQHSAKFGSNRYCDTRDIKLLVIEEQDSSYLLKSAVSVYL